MTPLVLLPGLLCDAEVWAAQAAGLADVADSWVADLTRDDSMPGMAARVLKEAPSVAYEPGATVPVWYSSEAPTFAYNHQWTNAVPVAALPERPGWGRFAVHALATLAIAIAGMRAASWVYQRYSLREGTLPVRRT